MNDEAVAYQEALDYLYSYVDYSLTHNFRYTPDKFDLGRMYDFLGLLDNPQKKYPVIHIAGTKGKGSTAALISSSFVSAGYQVGLYTSPHLQNFTERIQINGQEISQADLVKLVSFVKPFVAEVAQLTTFEVTTALAFLYFAQRKVDVAVVEVGLGGRLDATNVVDPLVSVITSLSMDHVSILGDTLPKIAFEKAGIIKPGRPVVLAPQPEEARQVIEAVAQERHSPLFEVGHDFLYTAGDHSLTGQSFKVWQSDLTSLAAVQLRTQLLGQHQVENGATAYAALQVAGRQGIAIDDQAIRDGFQSVQWPGRFELMRYDPPVVVDSAHNRESALRLGQALQDYLPGRPVVLVFGVSEDKDIEGMLAELLPRVSQVITTQSVHPRAIDAEKLAELARQHGALPVKAVLPVEAALAEALALAGNDAVVLVTGSLFIVAAVRDVWSKLLRQSENQSVQPV